MCNSITCLSQSTVGIRGGGTGPAGPFLAGPLFSDQVINIHKLCFTRYSLLETDGRYADSTVSSGHSQAWSSALCYNTKEHNENEIWAEFDLSFGVCIQRATDLQQRCSFYFGLYACLAMLEKCPKMHQNRSQSV